jgi:hypothetical protein
MGLMGWMGFMGLGMKFMLMQALLCSFGAEQCGADGVDGSYGLENDIQLSDQILTAMPDIETMGQPAEGIP